MPELPAHLPGAPGEDLARLTSLLARYGHLVVAFSGGADSALLAYVATATLGAERVQCATAHSPSLAPEDLADTVALAQEWSLTHRIVATDELDNPAYRANDLDRCRYCKTALMEVLAPLARLGGGVVALGVNRDDLGEHRPGQAAARDAGAVFPLLDAGLGKDDVRALSRALGLRTWDKPANACLSSRIPQGTAVSIQLLDTVGRAESVLRSLGYAQVRVRHHGEIARLELDPDELARAVDEREEIVDALRALGYRYVTLDLQGFRSGNLVAAAIERPSLGVRQVVTTSGARPVVRRRRSANRPPRSIAPRRRDTLRGRRTVRVRSRRAGTVRGARPGRRSASRSGDTCRGRSRAR